MLKILRCGPVSVQEIQIKPDHQPRVRVNLHQSWRYSLFCSQGTGPNVTAVAVESSNGLEGRRDEVLQVQNTFIGGGVPTKDVAFVRKPHSAPGAFATTEMETQADEESDAICDAASSSSKESPDEQHVKGCCQPCLFHSRHFADPAKYDACTKPDCWARCCHLPHSEDYLAKYKAQKRRYEKKNRVAFRKKMGQEWNVQEGEEESSKMQL
mmetsp:Transcript_29917/g.69222  ORF Transcript_29917/g.69222 Transcript_29917/m.69222 type:complete len:211 (-) Transcript_29917:125-757(-)